MTIELKSFKRALIIGKENMFSELSQIVSITEEANTVLTRMLSDCKNEKCLDEGTQVIHVLEEKSDSIAFKREDVVMRMT